MATRLLASSILLSPPSCIEFVPSSPEIFIVGTYELKASELEGPTAGSQRIGMLLVYSYAESELRLVQTISLPFAVLDLRFSLRESGSFVVASSIGTVEFFTFDRGSQSPVAHQKTCVVAPSPDILVLSLNWSHGPDESLLLAFSLSNGGAGVLDINNDDTRVESRFAQAHPLEVWTATLATGHLAPALYTGGDDSALCCHPIDRTPPLAVDVPSARSVQDFERDTKIHRAGVTAILPLWADREGHDLILTGSYDEYIRVVQITTRSKRAQVLIDRRLDGGVWQLKKLRSNGLFEMGPEPLIFWILASCMHAGCRVLKISREPQGSKEWVIEVVAKFEEHDSMNYASDAQPGSYQENVREAIFVSTSFYDKKLCVWKLADT